MGGDIFDDFVVNVVALQLLLFAQDGHSRFIIRRLDIYSQAPFKTGAETFFQRLDLLGRLIGGNNNLLFRLIKGVESVEKFLLRALLSYNKLNIVDQENVVVSVLFAELRGGDIVFITDGVDQLVGELFAGHV